MHITQTVKFLYFITGAIKLMPHVYFINICMRIKSRYQAQKTDATNNFSHKLFHVSHTTPTYNYNLQTIKAAYNCFRAALIRHTSTILMHPQEHQNQRYSPALPVRI